MNAMQARKEAACVYRHQRPPAFSPTITATTETNAACEVTLRIHPSVHPCCCHHQERAASDSSSTCARHVHKATEPPAGRLNFNKQQIVEALDR